MSSGVLRKFFEAQGYEVLMTKSGICLAAKRKFKMVRVTVSMHPNILSGVLKVGTNYLCVTTAYDPQESELTDERVNFYMELAAEIDSSMSRFSFSAVIGDLNAKLSFTNDKVSSDSPNGALLKEVLEKYNLETLNFSPKCSGKWTRVQKKKSGDEKSVIDYFITCQNLSPLVSKMIIDEDKTMAPFWVRKSKNKVNSVQHSDHNSIYIETHIPSSTEAQATSSNDGDDGYKITEDGLERFGRLSGEMEIVKDMEYTEFYNKVKDMMDKSFPKKKPFKLKNNINKENLITDKCLVQVVKVLIPFMKRGRWEKIAAKKYMAFLHEIQIKSVQSMKSARVLKTLSEINDDSGRLSIDSFWKLKKSLSSPDRSRSSIITREGVEIFGGPAVLNEYQLEFTNRLTHKPLEPRFANYEALTNLLFEKYLEAASSSQQVEPDFTPSETEKVIASLKAKSAYPENSFPGEIFKYGGNRLECNLTNALNSIKKSLVIPEMWIYVIVVTIFKNKGSRKLLEFYRGIFLTDIASKIMEKLVKSRIDPFLLKVSKLQAGSKKNRGPCDSMFLLNGMIDHAKYLNTELFITFYDYSTCFDSLWLEECMIGLWDLGICNDLFALIFRMNELSRIKVKSPHGMTDSFQCPRVVRQGTVLGPTLCSSSTAELCNRNHSGGVLVGSMTINDLIYVDDTTDVNTNIAEHVASHNEIVNFAWSKGLALNYPKCGQMIINQKSTTPVPTLIIGDGVVGQVKSGKVLGDVVNEQGTNIDLIDDRVKKGIGVIVSSLSICNEVTTGICFVMSALVMHNAVIVATLIFNSQAWTNLSQKDFERLEVVQLRHLKRIVRAPSSTANAFVFLELGVLPVIFQIHIRQLSFLHHIVNLEHDDPVKVMYEFQTTLPFEKNWTNNILTLLAIYNLDIADVHASSKEVWKASVKKAVKTKAFSMLQEECQLKSKTKLIEYDSFKCQEYLLDFDWKSASILFKLRGGVADCRVNKKSSAGDLSCRLCGLADESQEHVVNCGLVADDHIDIRQVYGHISSRNEEIVEIINRYDRFVSLVHGSDEES